MLNRLAKELGCVGTFKQPDPPWTLHVATAAVASASPTLAAETAAVAAGVATPSELRAETPCKEHPAPTSSLSQRQHVHGGAVVPQACVLLPADGSDRLEDQSTAIAELNQVSFDSRIGTPYIGDGGAGEGEVSSPAPATRLAAPAPAQKIVCIVAQSSYDAWCTSRSMPLVQPSLASVLSHPSDVVHDEQSKRLPAPPPFPFYFHRTIPKGTDLFRAESLLLNGTTVSMCVLVCVWTFENTDGLLALTTTTTITTTATLPFKCCSGLLCLLCVLLTCAMNRNDA